MLTEQKNRSWVIWLSILIALLLQVTPMAPQLAAWRPDWVILAVVYWVMSMPHRFNILSACMVGIVLDLLVGGTLGLRGLAMALIAYIVAMQYQVLRHAAPVQQYFVIFLLAALYHLIVFWVEYLISPNVRIHWQYFQPAVSTVFVWPWVLWLLQRTRRNFNVK